MKILDYSRRAYCQVLVNLMKPVATLFASLALLVSVPMSLAATVEYDLTVARQEVNFTGQSTRAMTINGRLPGPTLRFTEGDHAVIHIRNQMDVETSIHWHGILLPNAMDGVPFLTYPPIAADQTFTYKFDLRQSGTYWYHSHTRPMAFRVRMGGLVYVGGSENETAARLTAHVTV